MSLRGAPKLRTPDHPPYAVMIGAAIRHLGEEEGSTEAAISEYIRANYDDLPWGHDKLLPYYLNKLTAQGEFLVGAPGRWYMAAAYDDGRPVPAMAAADPPPDPELSSDPGDTSSHDVRRRRRGRPPKRKGTSVEASVTRDGGRNKCDNESEPSLRPRPAMTTVPPEEEENIVEQLEYVLALPCQGPTRTNVNGEDGLSTGVPERHKSKHSSVESSKFVLVDTEAIGGAEETGFSVPKRKPGVRSHC